MMNLTEMRTMVRRDLHDEDSINYRWTDEEIDRHIAHALNDLSEAIPDEQKTTVPTTPSSRVLDISDLANRIMIQAVEYPVDQFPPRFQRFALWHDMLTLLGRDIPDGSNACIYYGRLHILDTSGSTVPACHIDLLTTGAAAYAAYEWASYSINRVNTGGTSTPAQLLAWGKDRLVEFRSRLHTLGRKNRVRVRSLYNSYEPPLSRTADYGP
jgi:hypothetical protein